MLGWIPVFCFENLPIISFIDNFLIHLLVGQANALRLSIVSCDKQSDNCAWPAITLSSSRPGPSHCFKEKRFFEQAHNAYEMQYGKEQVNYNLVLNLAIGYGIA